MHTYNSILIADDSETNRQFLSKRLEQQGYTVATAEDGQCALEMMALEDFDLLLLDIMMPTLNGYDVLEKMRVDTKLVSVPVIVLTSDTESSNVIQCIELGANDYLVKPFDMVVLRNRINRCLLHRRIREDVSGELNWNGALIPDVLIVEDDEMSRDLLKKRISRANYNALAVADGQAAIEAMQAQAFDLVLLDIMMPGMSGYDVLKAIKADGAIANTSVIMISALDDQDTIEECLQAGAEDYITKPFNALILKSRVMSCLQAKRVRDQGMVGS